MATEYELTTSFQKVKIGWPLLYRNFALLALNWPSIEFHIESSGYARNNSGKMIKNARAYRRAGGSLNMTPPQITKDYLQAWVFFKTRAKDISKFLYQQDLKTVANPVYSFDKNRSVGMKKAVQSLRRKSDSMINGLTSRFLSIHFKRKIEAYLLSDKWYFRVDDKEIKTQLPVRDYMQLKDLTVKVGTLL